MPAFGIFVFSLGLSVVSCVNFTTVYEWGELELDLAWPSDANRTKAIEDGTFKPKNIEPHFMAVYKERIFLSLEDWVGVPVSLVSIPPSSASPAPPKLAPFRNWDFHGQKNCSNMHRASGIEVDNNGHLWVLDADNRWDCKPKLLIFNLDDGDKAIVAHHFDSPVSEHLMHIVIDQSPDRKQFAFITEYAAEHIIAFDRDQKKSWTVDTPGHNFLSIAISHQEEARRLYLCARDSKDLYSVSVADLRSGKKTAASSFIGKWEEVPYRMLIGSTDVLYAAFSGKDYISTWNISEPFNEQRFYQDGPFKTNWPFTFALDAAGTFWMTERNETTKTKPSHKLLKAAPAAVSPGPFSTSS